MKNICSMMKEAEESLESVTDIFYPLLLIIFINKDKIYGEDDKSERRGMQS